MEYYCLMVMTGTEAAFKESATRTLAAQFPGSEVYFFQRRLRTGRGAYYDAPLFPGYVFLRTERLCPAVVERLKGERNFCRLLPRNAEPQEIRGRALDELRLFLGCGEHLGVSRVVFLPGRQVRAVSGPMVGLEGSIYKINKKKKRITVVSSLSPDGKKFDLLYEDAELVTE